LVPSSVTDSSLLFFSHHLLLLSPRSTLFPYTTLFRSGDFLGQLDAEVLVRVVDLDLTGDGHTVVRDRGGAPRTRTTVTIAREVDDRKSTRLNSSHVSISYAVFCLKKKNTNNIHKNNTS